MTCVKCGAEMSKRSERGVLLDHCGACSGIWLDAGELERLQLGRPRHAAELHRERREEAARERGRAVQVTGLCPHCARPLEVELVARVEVDRCPACGGIFFDDGELQTILRDTRRGVLARLWQRLRSRGGPT